MIGTEEAENHRVGVKGIERIGGERKSGNDVNTVLISTPNNFYYFYYLIEILHANPSPTFSPPPALPNFPPISSSYLLLREGKSSRGESTTSSPLI